MLKVEVYLTGPTGCGKTRMAARLRQLILADGCAGVERRVNGETVSIDERTLPDPAFLDSLVVLDALQGEPPSGVIADLVAAAKRGLMALAANGAPNCEAAKELRAAIAKAEGAGLAGVKGGGA